MWDELKYNAEMVQLAIKCEDVDLTEKYVISLLTFLHTQFGLKCKWCGERLPENELLQSECCDCHRNREDYHAS
jgi:hypothetical protein